jgi:hypothetical protein
MAIDYSKIPHEDVTGTYRYTNLPKHFFEALAAGDITLDMFLVLAWVWNQAGYKTGIAKRASAAMIRDDVWSPRVTPEKGRPKLRTVRRILQRLQLCGFIFVPKKYINDTNYPICACGYVVSVDLDGDRRRFALRPKPIKSYREALKGDDRLVDTVFDTPDDTPLTDPCPTHDRPMTDPCPTPVRPPDPSLSGKQVNQVETGVAGIAGDQVQQQQPALRADAAAVAVTPTSFQEADDRIEKLKSGYKPEFRTTESGASDFPITANLVTAAILWDYLGNPAGQDPLKWEDSLGILSQDYDSQDYSLLDLFWYAFDVNPKWREKLLAAKYPVKYLETVLPHILDDYTHWSMNQEKEVPMKLDAAVKKLLASGEVFERDGKRYKFLAVQGYKPCYHEIDAQGNPVGIVGNLVWGLDLPLPEDALEGAGY